MIVKKSELEKYNETGEFDLELMVSTKIDDKLLAYLELYDSMKEYELKLDSIKEDMNLLKEEIISLFEALGITSKKLNGITIVKRVDTRAIVSDFDALINHIKNVMEEPVSEYTELKFDPKKLKLLMEYAVKQSIEQGKPLAEFMPDGLSQLITTTIQVRGWKEHE